MTIEEIFSNLINHMQEGIIYHNEIAKAYDFLGLWGFSKCHRYHYFEEARECSQITHYYASHYFKLIQHNITNPKIIPDTWYKYSTQAVDINTKRQAVKELMTKWIDWEKSTKELYQSLRQELVAIQEFDAVIQLDKCIHDVSKELSHAEKQLIKLESINYDITMIIDWQDNLYNKYKKKLGW